MTAPRYTSEQIQEAIVTALKERDFKAVNSLLHLLAVQDPDAAQAILDSMALAKLIYPHASEVSP